VALTVLDAGVLIAVLDAADAHHAAARAALSAVLDRGDALAVPASAYAETLVAPARRGAGAVRAVDTFLADLPADVEPITRQLAKRAAALRARHGQRLRLPDAFVLATALHLGADQVLTTDAGWPRAGIRVELIGVGSANQGP
jgi:predicted nucleic acid-binding protein